MTYTAAATARHVLRRLRVALVLGGFVIVGLSATFYLWDRINAELLARTPQDQVFLYSNIEYKGTDVDGLVMSSTAVWLRDIDRVTWNDRLSCNGGTFSSQDSSAENFKARQLRTVEWPYSAPYPRDGSTCVVVSTITATIDGAVWSQQIESDPFTPSTEDNRS